MSEPLKLQARDVEDIQVLSALFQDAIAPVCDIAFDPADKLFVMVAQRLRRAEGREDERICCGLRVTGVIAAHTHALNLGQAGLILNLLAIMLRDGAMEFMFAGGAKIRLELADWRALAEDFGESWPALCRPCHENIVDKE